MEIKLQTAELFKFNDMPTQSQLQQWLRDTHQIEIAVQWFDTCYIKAVNKKPFKANMYRVEGFQSYEECLEIALQEALNLIDEWVDLTYQERYKLWFANNFETGMEYNEEIIPDFDNEYYEPTPKRKLR